MYVQKSYVGTDILYTDILYTWVGIHKIFIISRTVLILIFVRSSRLALIFSHNKHHYFALQTCNNSALFVLRTLIYVAKKTADPKLIRAVELLPQTIAPVQSLSYRPSAYLESCPHLFHHHRRRNRCHSAPSRLQRGNFCGDAAIATRPSDRPISASDSLW